MILLIILELLVLTFGLLFETNYNYSQVHEQALNNQPLSMPFKPLLNSRRRVAASILLQLNELKKYNLKDTNYRPPEILDPIDKTLLYSMQPPEGMFGDDIGIENYRLLQIRLFNIELRNPSKKYKLKITKIINDRSQFSILTYNQVVLQPGQSNIFNFLFHSGWLHPQYIHGFIYFKIQVYDHLELAEEKIYARKISASIIHNHFRMQTPIRHSYYPGLIHPLTIKNYQLTNITIYVTSSISLVENQKQKKQSFTILPTKSVTFNVSATNWTQIITKFQGRNFTSLWFFVHIQPVVTIDYNSIGILPQQKTVLQVALSGSSLTVEPAVITQLLIHSSSQTVSFQIDGSFNNSIDSLVKHKKIGILRVYASKQTQTKVRQLLISMYVTVGNQSFWTNQKVIYAQIRHPVSVGSSRFINLRALNDRGKQERFVVRNNLNFPLLLIKATAQSPLLKITRIQQRQLVAPNHSMEQLLVTYVGIPQISISPLKVLLCLEMSGNVIIPIQIVIFDQSLQCVLDKQPQKCSNLSIISFGYFPDLNSKTRQITLRNWNPLPTNLKIKLPNNQALEHGLNLTTTLYGPLPSDHSSSTKRIISGVFQQQIRGNRFIVLNFQLQPFQNVSSAALPIQFITSTQHIVVLLTVRVESASIALLPQKVHFHKPTQKIIDYLNLVSTYSQSYHIANLTTDLTGLTIAFPAHLDLYQNQFFGMTIVYDPTPPILNTTDSQWNNKIKQIEYVMHRLNKKYQSIITGNIKLTTSTDLTVTSIVTVDRYDPWLLNCEPDLQGVCVIEIYTSLRYKSIVDLKLNNSFPSPLKIKTFLLHPLRFSYLQYFKEFINVPREKQDCVICVSRQTPITSQAIKTAFSLQFLPEFSTLQETISNGNKIITSSSSQFIMLLDTNIGPYLKKWAGKSSSNCYRFQHHPIVNKLIQTQFYNKVLQVHGSQLFIEVIKTDLSIINNGWLFQEHFLPILSKLSPTIKKDCYNTTYSMLSRVCQELRKTIYVNKQQFIVESNKLATINLNLNPSQKYNEAYLILANNFTAFQTYKIKIIAQNPLLQIRIKKSKEQQLLDNQNSKTILLSYEDLHKDQKYFEGIRFITIINHRKQPLVITHIGINQRQKCCSHKGLHLWGLTCTSEAHTRQVQSQIKINQFDQHNITLYFRIPIQSQLSISPYPIFQNKNIVTIYIYQINGGYFKFPITFQIDSKLETKIQMHIQTTRQPLISPFLLSITSLFVIFLLFYVINTNTTLTTFKNKYPQLSKARRLLKMFRQSRYDVESMMIARLPGKSMPRPLHKVSQNLLLSAKEVTQRDFKRYFNQSEQSAIGNIGNQHILSLSHFTSEHEEQSAQYQESSQKSSNYLPQGEEVQLKGQQQSSYYDFNHESSQIQGKSLLVEQNSKQITQELQYYNIFKSQNSLQREGKQKKQ